MYNSMAGLRTSTHKHSQRQFVLFNSITAEIWILTLTIYLHGIVPDVIKEQGLPIVCFTLFSGVIHVSIAVNGVLFQYEVAS